MPEHKREREKKKKEEKKDTNKGLVSDARDKLLSLVDVDAAFLCGGIRLGGGRPLEVVSGPGSLVLMVRERQNGHTQTTKEKDQEKKKREKERVCGKGEARDEWS